MSKPKKGKTGLIKATDSQFAQESRANAPAVAPGQLKPSPGMLALFQKTAREIPAMKKMQRLNLPQLVKPQDKENANIPIGGTISGVIVDVVKSPTSTVKGSLLWLHLVSFDDSDKPKKTGIEITFPATGCIRNALAPGIERELHEDARLAMQKWKGFLLVAQRTDDKMDRNYGKVMTMWDVRLSPKAIAVDLGIDIN